MNRTRFSCLIASLVLLFSVQSIAQDKVFSSIDASLVGVPLYDFDRGYFGFAGSLSVRVEILSNLYLGINTFHHRSNLYVSRVESKSNTTGIVPSLRYVISSNNRFALFSDIGFGLGAVRYEAINPGLDYLGVSSFDGAVTVFNIGLGVQYRLSDLVGLELVVPYIQVANKTKAYNTNYNTSAIFEGIGPMIGINFHLRE